MIIIPSTPDLAKPLLEQVQTQRMHCTLFVFGDDEERRTIASKADVRAENHPFRKVVWVPVPEVMNGLPGCEQLTGLQGEGTIVAALSFRFTLCSKLGPTDTIDFVALEEAFIRALGAT